MFPLCVASAQRFIKQSFMCTLPVEVVVTSTWLFAASTAALSVLLNARIFYADCRLDKKLSGCFIRKITDY